MPEDDRQIYALLRMGIYGHTCSIQKRELSNIDIYFCSVFRHMGYHSRGLIFTYPTDINNPSNKEYSLFSYKFEVYLSVSVVLFRLEKCLSIEYINTEYKNLKILQVFINTDIYNYYYYFFFST